jgi:hypothetical protein
VADIMSWLKPKPVIVREGVLQEVADKLFPEPEEVEKDGMTIIVDRSVDSNLWAALTDLDEGTNDKVTRDTIRACARKLDEVRALLNSYHPINEKARYLMVDVPKSKVSDVLDD